MNYDISLCASNNPALAQWLTPLQAGRGEILAAHPEGSLLSYLPAGKGRVVYCGGYPVEACRAKPDTGFENFVAWVVRKAGTERDIEVMLPPPDPVSFLYVKHGMSLGRRVIVSAGCEITPVTSEANMRAFRKAAAVL